MEGGKIDLKTVNIGHEKQKHKVVLEEEVKDTDYTTGHERGSELPRDLG